MKITMLLVIYPAYWHIFNFRTPISQARSAAPSAGTGEQLLCKCENWLPSQWVHRKSSYKSQLLGLQWSEGPCPFPSQPVLLQFHHRQVAPRATGWVPRNYPCLASHCLGNSSEPLTGTHLCSCGGRKRVLHSEDTLKVGRYSPPRSTWNEHELQVHLDVLRSQCT